MKYVDGFVIPLPKKNLAAYRTLSKKASKIWMDHGALDYRECVAEDMNVPCGLPFPKLTKAKPSETIVFAYIVYKSRAHRDQVNKKVMADPRIAKMCDPKRMPFDAKRMSYGGFQTLVEG